MRLTGKLPRVDDVDSQAISDNIFQDMNSELGTKIVFKTGLERITGTSMKENLRFISEIIDVELPSNFEIEFRRRSYEA